VTMHLRARLRVRFHSQAQSFRPFSLICDSVDGAEQVRH
jgi:hypothetical protein